MQRLALVAAMMLVTACPGLIGPKDSTASTDGADDGKTTGPEEPPAPAKPEQGGEPAAAQTCEDELAAVRAALAECQAAQK